MDTFDGNSTSQELTQQQKNAAKAKQLAEFLRLGNNSVTNVEFLTTVGTGDQAFKFDTDQGNHFTVMTSMNNHVIAWADFPTPGVSETIGIKFANDQNKKSLEGIVYSFDSDASSLRALISTFIDPFSDELSEEDLKHAYIGILALKQAAEALR